MAIQRPVKTYGTRTYVAEVAAAPANEDPILASEVDADLDTIYSAFNTGANTWTSVGSTITPTDATKTVAAANLFEAGSATMKGRVKGDSTGLLQLSANLRGDGTTSDDGVKPSWTLQVDPVADVVQVFRRPTQAGSFTQLLTLNSVGKLLMPGVLQSKAWAGGVNGTGGQTVNDGVTAVVSMTSVWVDSAGGVADAPNSQCIAPSGINTWIILTAWITFDANAGSGLTINIEYYTGSGWASVGRLQSNTAAVLTLTRLTATTAGSPFRVTCTNATGATRTINNAYFSLAVLGTW